MSRPSSAARAYGEDPASGAPGAKERGGGGGFGGFKLTGVRGLGF